MSEIDDLLRGSYDMHVHFSPDPYRVRRVDAVELAMQAQAAGMGGVVFKSHFYGTTPVVYVTRFIAKDIRLFGSIALDNEVGGLNPEAVDSEARMGAKVMWLPTFSARADRTGSNKSGKTITVLDDNGRLLPVAREILELVRKYNMVLGTGHLGKEEIFAVLEAGKEIGLEKMIVTHAMSGKVAASLSIEEQRQAVRLGAFIEHCVLSLMPTGERADPAEFAEAIKAVGEQHCILSTDLGQMNNPTPVEGMRMFISIMLGQGISPAAVEMMVKTNPAQLLDVS